VRLALLVEMAYRQGELKPDERRSDVYRCDVCEHHGLFRDRQRRQCLKHYEAASIPVAKVDPDRGLLLSKEFGERSVGREALLDELLRLKLETPGRSYLELCELLCVCPTALVEREDWHLAELEGGAREYGAGYLSAYGYGAEPPARVLDAFAAIREARNEEDARRLRTRE